MSPPVQIQNRTRIFARVLGPYLFLSALTLVIHTSYMRALLSDLDANTLWPWVIGAFVLPVGLIVIMLHPYWRGAAAITVSLLGWLTAVKGLALMAIPENYLAWGHKLVDTGAWWQVSSVAVALVGLYLIVIGWLPEAGRRAPEGATRPPHDLPRAA